MIPYTKRSAALCGATLAALLIFCASQLTARQQFANQAGVNEPISTDWKHWTTLECVGRF
jgi:hypothetical protein